MRKTSIAILLLISVLIFQFCTGPKKSSKGTTTSVTYEMIIKPEIEANCTPCHIMGKGNKKPLDNYAAASSSADDIIARIQRNPGERGFMPAMHAKLPDSVISLFVQWKGSGLKEK